MAYCFVSFLSLQFLFRFVVLRFVSLCFFSFRCVLFLFRFSLYRDPQFNGPNKDSLLLGRRTGAHREDCTDRRSDLVIYLSASSTLAILIERVPLSVTRGRAE